MVKGEGGVREGSFLNFTSNEKSISDTLSGFFV